MPRKRPEGTRAPNGASTIYLGADGSWHGRVTVGVKDNGKPDRRHVRGKTETEAIAKVRKLERERNNGTVRKTGRPWTVARWLEHWVENIAAPSVGENTIDGYRVAVRVHLVPGLGAHRLEKLEPEHVEALMQRMQTNGSAAATAHQALRTLRTALGEAVRRGHLGRNVASLAKPPRVVEKEVEPYSVAEVQQLLAEAAKQRNSARWVLALALGLRQGEALGLRWPDLDLDAGVIRIRRGRLRPKYRHGCATPCGRKPGFCRDKVQIRADTKETKSRAGTRTIGLPDELIEILRRHKERQDKERAEAGNLWRDGGWLFASETGSPLNPGTDYHEWKDLLVAAGLRTARLHDARHTAATVLLLLGVPDRTVMGIMGWSTDQRSRYQHMTDPVLKDVAGRLNRLLWLGPASAEGPNETGTETR
ncbi:site-specific integrase [Frankia sp. AgB1.9]|uniref:tyrosine-type recombinase/integrase n=1 Tax=unclassified Frankia TaxID=2632575 RepID=UPI0019330B56|nr:MULTISPECIES: site-specific integrase [unclassified Frankia]MBL7494480.1 site-specific integrase [Frankia sp. AgW1.1]MBL7550980.1 site-specific integrase [Frankia sp. AgB1.9]MBL7623624.1 site-specific integrase [Frankia sp. AgB1.8]